MSSLVSLSRTLDNRLVNFQFLFGERHSTVTHRKKTRKGLFLNKSYINLRFRTLVSFFVKEGVVELGDVCLLAKGLCMPQR